MLIFEPFSLSLDVLSNQLIKVDELSKSDNVVDSSLQLNASVPFTVLKTVLSEHDFVNKALVVLRGRATSARYDLNSRPSADFPNTQVSHFFRELVISQMRSATLRPYLLDIGSFLDLEFQETEC